MPVTDSIGDLRNRQLLRSQKLQRMAHAAFKTVVEEVDTEARRKRELHERSLPPGTDSLYGRIPTVLRLPPQERTHRNALTAAACEPRSAKFNQRSSWNSMAASASQLERYWAHQRTHICVCPGRPPPLNAYAKRDTPPATSSAAPVMKLAARDPRNAIAAAASAGDPIRPKGICLSRATSASHSSIVCPGRARS